MEYNDVHSSEQEDVHLLLRFPENIRKSAGLPVSSGAYPKPSKTNRPHKKRRWLLRLVLLTLLLGLGLSGVVAWALELEYREHQQLAQRSAQLKKEWSAAKDKLQQGRKKAIYNSLPRYLQHLDQTLTLMQRSYNRYCKAPKRKPLQWKWPNDRQTFQAQWHNVRRWSWQSLRKPFIKARTWVAPKTKKLQTANERRKHCQNQTQALLSQLKVRLESSSQQLLQEARRHLRWYQWCHVTWTRYEHDPEHHAYLSKLRNNSCRSACRRRNSRSCRSCWLKQRLALHLSKTRMRQYRRLLRQESNRRCKHWIRKNKKPSHQGIFHVGEYFWRVQRVLSYTHWLDRHKMCDASCQTLRKEWGFQLKLSADKTNARIYVRLWPEYIKAPTSWLRQIAEKPLGKADGNLVWLPALRTDLVPSPIPRQLWYLLLVVEPKSRHSALLPLAPEAGGTHEQSIQLKPIEIYNDGRQLVRYPSFSQDGKWLSFATIQPGPGEPTPDLDSPLCVTLPKTPTTQWRSAISVYPVNAKGLPTSRGVHLKTQASLRYLQFEEFGTGLNLLVSSQLSPEEMKEKTSEPVDPLLLPAQPQNKNTDGVSLWKMGVNPQGATPFGTPNRISRSSGTNLDLPFQRGTHFPSVLRMRCPTPSSLQLLHNGPERPDMLPLPQGYKLLHATSSQDWVALLLHRADTGTPALMRQRRPLRWGEKPDLKRLLSPFRQVQQVGDWTLLAGANLKDPVLGLSPPNRQTLWEEQPHVRYLDPAIHWRSRRIFVVQHWKIPGSSSWKPSATFLVSRPLPKSFLTAATSTQDR